MKTDVMLGEIKIHSHCDHRFSSVKEAFADNFRTRGDVGASFAATIDGRFVIDIWEGYANAGLTHPWEHDTLAVSIHDKDDDGSVRVDTGRPRRLCRKGDHGFWDKFIADGGEESMSGWPKDKYGLLGRSSQNNWAS